MKARLRIAFLPALALAAGLASAQPAPQPPDPGPRRGPGMMDEYGRGYGRGPGMMGGYGRGYGTGPGMGGYGRGYGTGPGMGGYGMGPGGPGGWGPGGWGPGLMGHGMMGGPMMGAGIGRALLTLDLEDAQRQQLLKLHDEQRRKHWELMGKMHDEMAKLRDAWMTPGKRDRAALSAAYRQLGELRQQAFESSLDAADRLDEILTAEQREQLRRTRGPWWMMDETE